MNEQTVLRHDDVSLQYLAVDLDELNGRLEHMAAEDRVAWGLEHFGERIVLSSSFGAQAAVSLHMVTRQRPDIPVVLIDTGHLFPETYQFVEQLSEQLSLNLHVFRPKFSSHWQEQRFGRLWEQGIDGIEVYNRINKVEPMNRALRELAAQAWFSGIRRDQSSTRAGMRYVMARNRRMKVHPILDWSDRDVYRYLTHHHLPYHPLWHQGYVSIGDVHTTSKLGDGMSEADTRFFGLKRECGIHEDV